MIKNNNIFFNEDSNLKFAEDFEFNLRLVTSSSKPLKLLCEPLVYYRQHSGNNVNVLSNAENSLNVLDLYKNRIPRLELYKVYRKIYFNLCVLAYKVDLEKCREYYFRGFFYNFLNLKSHIIFLLSVTKLIFPKLK